MYMTRTFFVSLPIEFIFYPLIKLRCLILKTLQTEHCICNAQRAKKNTFLHTFQPMTYSLKKSVSVRPVQSPSQYEESSTRYNCTSYKHSDGGGERDKPARVYN